MVLRLTRFFGLCEYQYAVTSVPEQGNTTTGWVLTRNYDGSIPAKLGGVLTKYTNSYGTWTETLLETGEIMLEGYGEVSGCPWSEERKSYVGSVNLPKSVVKDKSNVFIKPYISISGGYSAYDGKASTDLSFVNNPKLELNLHFNTKITTYQGIVWNFKGILLQ